MSIYVSAVSFDDDISHEVPGCALYVSAAPDAVSVWCTDGTSWRRDDSKTCSCGGPPLLYRGSHVLPDDADLRGGSFDLAEIPGFIQRVGRPTVCDEETCEKPGTVCCDQVWPWLRVSIGPETVVLDRRQVARVHEYLGGWLERCPDEVTEPAGG